MADKDTGDVGVNGELKGGSGNRARVNRLAEIGRTADARRANQLLDVDGERTTGRFAGGEFDNTPEAREAAAARAEEEAAQALRDAQELGDEAERARARALQTEGASDKGETEGGARTDNGTARSARPSAEPPPADDEEADSQVIDGKRYYKVIVEGEEKWLTMRELRESVGRGIATEETLQRAQEALRSATQGAPASKPAPPELDDAELEKVILLANMGDEEAVRTLVTVLKNRPNGPSAEDIDRLVNQRVSQQIATQRAVDEAEDEQADILGNPNLEPEFRRRLNVYAKANPKKRIQDAFKAVGDKMRQDFAAMLPIDDGRGNRRPNPAHLTKEQRKRTAYTPPPQAAGKRPQEREAEGEVPVGDTIDAIARSRGQARAHRVRMS